MDKYPQNLVDQYLKASNRLKKFERVVFKRFGPNVVEVQDEFARLAVRFEEAGIYQYAAMCHLGCAKCEKSTGNAVSECHAYLKAARNFRRADVADAALELCSSGGEYKEGALRCYSQAMERSADDAVQKAAIIREMASLQPHYEGTSSFASPAHRIYELELAAHGCLQRRNFLAALQQLDDIVDSIDERKQQQLYETLLQRVEVLRVLLLVVLSLPPARQSPAHIKLIEHYCSLARFEQAEEASASALTPNNYSGPGVQVPLQMQYALAEVVLAWHECKPAELKLALEAFGLEFESLNEAHRFVMNCISEGADKSC